MCEAHFVVPVVELSKLTWRIRSKLYSSNIEILGDVYPDDELQPDIKCAPSKRKCAPEQKLKRGTNQAIREILPRARA